FILSTWHSNEYRENTFLQTLWSGFHVLTQEHFYHVGAKEVNRKPMLEALAMNFLPVHRHEEPEERPEQLMLFEKVAEYQALTSEAS
ncbi:MAG: DNA adenine methylase, partial [Planctomycetes bacterium]|nr:DNA adenine methylase [Planctomycetota bacterium]